MAIFAGAALIAYTGAIINIPNVFALGMAMGFVFMVVVEYKLANSWKEHPAIN